MRRLCAVFWAFLLGCGILSAGASGTSAAPQVPNIGVTGTQGEFFQPDPKRPGKFLWKIWAQSGFVSAMGNGYGGTLSGVTALLFDKGKAAALLRAPKAAYNSATQVITASGRVTVVSQTEVGTNLVADMVTWNAKTNKIIATGNVVYRKGPTGLTLRVPRLDADTVLKSASFGTGSATLH